MLPSSPFTRSEARDFGIRDREWRALRAEGLVREVFAGMYVDAALPDTLPMRLAVSRRVLGESVVVCRRTAAWLHGLDVLDSRGFPATPRIETVTSQQGRRPTNPLMTAYVADDLMPSDMAVVDGLRITTPLRTVCDLARGAPRPDALVAMDAYLNRGVLDRDRVIKHLVRWKGRRGIRQAYAIAEIADAGSASGGESRMRLRLLDMGLPRPELQIPVHDLFGKVRFLLDLGWRRWMLALEYDGQEFHPEERRARDEARRAWIEGRGWTIRAFRREDLFTSSGRFEEDVTALVRGVAPASASVRRTLGGPRCPADQHSGAWVSC